MSNFYCTFAVSMRKNTYIFIGLILLLLVLALVDTCSGSVWISPLSVFNSQLSTLNSQLLLHLRLPKMLTAILAGAALSVAGLMMQTLFFLTKNSLKN